MPTSEIRAVLLLATLFSFRLLGLFMILPVFTLYAPHYQHATPYAIGIAIGIYGLTQALCQLPLGFLSDRIGRKPVLFIGLSLFALGSLVASAAHQFSHLIIGRALQGSGAIGSTLLATASDLTSTQHRAKAMAIIGITIGATFSLAMILGPSIASHYQLSGIFFFTFLLAICGIFLIYFLPTTPPKYITSITFLTHFKNTLTPIILFFNFGILLLHALLTANFIVIPLILVNQYHFIQSDQWIIYLPVLILSALSMSLLLRYSEKQTQILKLFNISIILLFISQLSFCFFNHAIWKLFINLFIFFTAFNTLEALLPSLISYFAPQEIRGAALGFYSTCQFLGIFLGGALGGFMYGQFSTLGVFLLGLSFTVFWLLLSFFIFRRHTSWQEALIK